MSIGGPPASLPTDSSGTQQLAEGLHPVVWAGLALTLLGVVVATGSAIALTRPVVLETLEPKLANES